MRGWRARSWYDPIYVRLYGQCQRIDQPAGTYDASRMGRKRDLRVRDSGFSRAWIGTDRGRLDRDGRISNEPYQHLAGGEGRAGPVGCNRVCRLRAGTIAGAVSLAQPAIRPCGVAGPAA